MWYIISCCYGNSYVRRTYQRSESRIRKHVPKYTIDLFINKVLTMQKEAINIFTGWRWPHRPQQSSNRCWRRRNDVLAVCKGDVTDMQTNCNFKHVEGSLWVAALHTQLGRGCTVKLPNRFSAVSLGRVWTRGSPVHWWVWWAVILPVHRRSFEAWWVVVSKCIQLLLWPKVSILMESVLKRLLVLNINLLLLYWNLHYT